MNNNNLKGLKECVDLANMISNPSTAAPVPAPPPPQDGEGDDGVLLEEGFKIVRMGKAAIRMSTEKGGPNYFEYPGLGSIGKFSIIEFIIKAYGIPKASVMTDPRTVKAYRDIGEALPDFANFLKINEFYSFSRLMKAGESGRNVLGWYLKNVKKKNIKGNYPYPEQHMANPKAKLRLR